MYQVRKNLQTVAVRSQSVSLLAVYIILFAQQINSEIQFKGTTKMARAFAEYSQNLSKFLKNRFAAFGSPVFVSRKPLDQSTKKSLIRYV